MGGRQMQVDRELQKKWLLELKEHYPRWIRIYDIAGMVQALDDNSEHAEANLYYLMEHGLVDRYGGSKNYEKQHEIITARITQAGIDFLEDDGGLSAILGTITVKLHADTIRDLIDAKIVESKSIPEQEKPALREALKRMKEDGLKQLTTRLISYGLDQGAITAQQLIHWLHS